MNKEKISSQEIIDLVATKASVSKRAAEEFLKVMIATIEDALLAGESVKIKNFGTFKLQWNEPRKSVNIQTGEEIILSGYHKVSFVPETNLKELVNEPFAHLEAVVLDDNSSGIESQPDGKTDAAMDPLRTFTEQASEIKSIISEIQALSATTKPEPTEIEKVEETEFTVENETIVDYQEEEETTNQVVVDVQEENEDVFEEEDPIEIVSEEEMNNEMEESVVPELSDEDVEEKPEPVGIHTISMAVSESTSNPFLNNQKPKKKSKIGWVVLAVFVLLAGIGTDFISFILPQIKLCRLSGLQQKTRQLISKKVHLLPI
jgi:nucleoid DNA-binding protein